MEVAVEASDNADDGGCGGGASLIVEDEALVGAVGPSFAYSISSSSACVFVYCIGRMFGPLNEKIKPWLATSKTMRGVGAWLAAAPLPVLGSMHFI
jgi:hypothetical protein